MSKKSALVIVLSGVLAIVALSLYVRGGPPAPPGVGDPAPSFNGLPTLTGHAVSLGDYRGRVLILNFWATWCPPCVEEAPSLERFSEKVAPRGAAVVGVSVDVDRNTLEGFVAEHHLTFTVARDPTRALPTRYGTLQFPETYILDRYGRVAEKIIGPTDWDDPRLMSFVEELTRPNGASGR